MDTATFETFRKIVYDKSGITLGPSKEALVAARVGKRMRSLGMQDYRQYLQFVLDDRNGDETVELLDAISTNVTSFYREPNHFTFLAEQVGKWLAKGQKRLRIWCAASSTGEEPYTIAMTLLETARDPGTDMKILATDISTRVLRDCEAATYSAAKVKTVSPELRERYFDACGDHHERSYTVKRRVKDIISFARLNLAKPPYPMKGPFDVVFCRNVMIYFDNEVRRRLLNEVERLLRPGGYLLVGHAESLTGMLINLKVVRPSIYMKS